MQVITLGCLSKLLTWAKAKQQSLKSSADNTGSLPTDLSGIVYAVIYKIHTHGTSSRSAPSLQLKSRPKLPAFWHHNRSVNTALSAGNANCCLVAQCLYVALANTPERKTPADRKRASKQNAELRQSEQSLDRPTSRKKVRLQVDDQRQQERSAVFSRILT